MLLEQVREHPPRLPAGVLIYSRYLAGDRGVLAVADSGNNRVTLWSADT